MNFSTDLHGSLRMNGNHSNDLLTFHLIPPGGYSYYYPILLFMTKYQRNLMTMSDISTTMAINFTVWTKMGISSSLLYVKPYTKIKKTNLRVIIK